MALFCSVYNPRFDSSSSPSLLFPTSLPTLVGLAFSLPLGHTNITLVLCRHTRMSLNASALYVPVITPPTPAPSPGPSSQSPAATIPIYNQEFSVLSPFQRRQFLSAILHDCTPDELLFVSTTLAPLLKRDFLRELPPELAIHVLGFIDDPRSLLRAGEVSRYWHGLASEDCLWKAMCETYDFHVDDDDDEWEEPNVKYNPLQPPSPISPLMNGLCPQSSDRPPPRKFSHYNHFKMSYECRTSPPVHFVHTLMRIQ